MRSRDFKHLIVSETTRVKLRKKNGMWINVMSKVTSFVTRVFNSSHQSSTPSFRKSLVRGGVAAGVLMGGALMVPSQTAYAAELETEENLVGQDVVTLTEETKAEEAKVEAVEETKSLSKPYYDSDKTTHQYYMLDGFILSNNITVNSLETVDLGFKNSDHNPVIMSVTLD